MSDERKFKHCDDYIHDLKAPMALRWFLYVNRIPAVDKLLLIKNVQEPSLFADYWGRRVRVVSASRLGDVGIRFDCHNKFSAEKHVAVEELTNFSPTYHMENTDG